MKFICAACLFLTMTTAVGSRGKTVTFRFFTAQDGSFRAQPILPVEFRLELISGPQEPSSYQCQVSSGEDHFMRMKCGDSLYKITGTGFEIDK